MVVTRQNPSLPDPVRSDRGRDRARERASEGHHRLRDEHREGWTFLTNHSHVLICLARDPQMRIRDLAAEVGITERSVQAIVGDLEDAGCLVRHREGRRNRYEVIRDRPMRHRVEREHVIGELLDVLAR